MLMEKVLQAAQPQLAGRIVKDIVIGISLIGIELDNGSVGVSYLLREDLPCGCGAFPYVLDELIGKDAPSVAELAITGEDVMSRAIGIGVLAAASDSMDIPNDSIGTAPFGLDITPESKVGMIGLIVPIAKQIAAITPNLVIFDNHIPSIPGLPPVQPREKQEELLSQCDIVLLSGTTCINGSIDSLLEICKGAKEIVMIGQSTPMFAEGWKGSGITRLAGANWDNSKKDEIFHDIARACGTMHLAPYMRKKRADLF